MVDSHQTEEQLGKRNRLGDRSIAGTKSLRREQPEELSTVMCEPFLFGVDCKLSVAYSHVGTLLKCPDFDEALVVKEKRQI
jgi:hypothetical protein